MILSRLFLLWKFKYITGTYNDHFQQAKQITFSETTDINWADILHCQNSMTFYSQLQTQLSHSIIIKFSTQRP